MKLRLWELIYAYARCAGHTRECAIKMASMSMPFNTEEWKTDPNDREIVMKLCEFAVDFEIAILDVLEPEDLKEWRN